MYKTIIALASLLLASAGIARAAEDTNKWEGSAAAGATLTKGNSDTFLGNITLNAARKRVRDEVLLGASGTYGTTKTEERIGNTPFKHDTEDTTTANASGFGQYNYLFTERFYGGLRLDLLHDAIADVKYRATLSPLAGYYLIKNSTDNLAVEAGPSFIAERLGNDDEQYVALRLAERYEHKFSAKARVWQSIEILPRVDDFGDYLINAEIGAEASLTDKVALRGVLQDNYDHQPADGRKQNDLKLITSIVYRF